MTRILGDAENIIKKTRVAHPCTVCQEEIPKGSSCKWQTNTGISGMDFGTSYWHMDCDPSQVRFLDGGIFRTGRTGLIGNRKIDIQYFWDLEERIRILENACKPPHQRKKTGAPGQLSILEVLKNGRD
jgi:hypothetical protein